ncbi:MAG: NfeD family protein [Elusimicrobiota bacterium]
MLWPKWMLIAAVLMVIEIVTPGSFFFACLSIGAISAGLISLLKVAAWVQWIVFITVSILTIYFVKPIAKKFFIPTAKKFNVDALIGKKVWVTEKIEPANMGMVKAGGALWRAECDVAVEPNTWVEVTAVDGSHLIVKPAQSN